MELGRTSLRTPPIKPRAHEELGKRGIPLAFNQVQYSLLARKP